MSERKMQCPECGKVASVAPWCSRPICIHTWDGGESTQVRDGDDTDGEGGRIEDSPNPEYRKPGPDTWTEMVPLDGLSKQCVCGEPDAPGTHRQDGPCYYG